MQQPQPLRFFSPTQLVSVERHLTGEHATLDVGMRGGRQFRLATCYGLGKDNLVRGDTVAGNLAILDPQHVASLEFIQEDEQASTAKVQSLKAERARPHRWKHGKRDPSPEGD